MGSQIVHLGRIEGYAIISEDGMIADAAGVMPDTLKFEADQKFFEHSLNGLDVLVHGRHSRERHLRSQTRRRLIVTHRVPTIAVDPLQENLAFWNPAGASFEEAMTSFGISDSNVGVIGGTDVFGLFLHRYDYFYLTQAPGVQLPAGRPVFPEVPARTPEEVLAAHGLVPGQRLMLDATKGLSVVNWQRLSRWRKSA
jgi:dihydrofolate reductase